MKRLVATIVFGALAVVALAQAPFTIVRPLDGAKVREAVRIQVPKNSIQPNQFVGVFLDGKFVEARILDLNGKFYEYVLDTKERRIADGDHRIELVLYAEGGDKPRVVDKSSIDVTVANSTSIQVPKNGFLLRYKYRPGLQYPFKVDQRVKVQTISEAQAKMGGRAATLDVEGESLRMLYAIDNAYSNGDGLLRMQAMPDRGRDFAMITAFGDEEPQKYMDHQMHPIYMRVTNTGLEAFGSVPLYIPIEGSAGGGARTDLFASLPLPTLPTKAVRPGDSWRTRFQLGKLDLEKLHEVSSVTEKAEARGEFLGVEWEMGHPCAKLRHSIAVSATMAPSAVGSGGKTRDGMGGDKVQLEETFWFALDLGMVIKIVEDMQVDTKIADAPPPQQQGGAAGGLGGGPSAAGSSTGGPQQGGQQGGGGNTGIGVSKPSGPTGIGQRGGPGGEDSPRGQRGGPQQGGGRLGGGQTGGRAGAPAVGSIRYLRYRIQRIQTLDL